MSDLEQEFGFTFSPASCQICRGFCCRGEAGYIFVDKKERSDLCDFLGIAFEELDKLYLTKVGYKYSFQEKETEAGDFACVFFDMEQHKCQIYPVRPRQCRTFPFWESFKQKPHKAIRECPYIKPLSA